ncbi:hypothetical protein QCA50_000446 [Cerrena zonata]|uniref:ATPase AAA-type core domain-containing protein n=1 Tax=Cerrena zonata TaxID=2478898 RepID=A0AAW0GXY8_9APHY
MSQTKAKGGTKRTRKTKGQPDGSQRTLKDMFGAKPSASTGDEPSISSLDHVDVVEKHSEEYNSSNGGATPKEELITIASEDELELVIPKPKKPSQPLRVFPIFQKLQLPPEGSEQEAEPSRKALEDVINIDSESDIDISSADSKLPSGRLTPKVSNPRPPSNPVGYTREDPIVIEQSPEREVPKQPAKALWTLFRRPDLGPSTIPGSVSTAKQPTRKFAQPGLNLPDPDADSQHVRGPQTSFIIPTLPFTHRDKGKGRAVNRDLDSDSEPGPPIFLSTYRKLKHEVLQPSHPIHNKHDQSLAPHTSIHTSPASNSQPDTPLSPEGIPRAHNGYPAIARFSNEAYLQQLRSDVSFENLQWTEKWRPRRADEVLGNEERAMYLKDWLVALRLQYDGPKVNTKSKSKSKIDLGTVGGVGTDGGGSGTASGSSSQTRKRKLAKVKKPTVIRQVKKRRKIDYDDLDGFVAADDEIEEVEDPMSISDDDLVEFFRNQASSSTPASAASSPPSSYPSSPPAVDLEDDEAVTMRLFQSSKPMKFGQSIHNTILLAGPHGSGKTAAVYACAEELGWEVFEVYPGIGQRCGPELHRLIGDVGKHHMVNTKRNDQNNNAAPSLFQPPARKTGRLIVQSDDDEDHDVVTSLILMLLLLPLLPKRKFKLNQRSSNL